ncbi:non-ribosomal peptide synthetase [Plantactinospora soyae]|uniref:Amino acid adenylation domain-containing protein n=1 Tax=Plantactinospora soyae TaxID=1544732 RepID=A0A927R530_9ACTN|nr:non-ribosomal peptide synthetase [Plantactinospora soyae]MBE1485551.1 amino acid adenylation domain-containing protein [Plantactinospora soyae]
MDDVTANGRTRRTSAPLSYAQLAIWRAEQLVPGTALHNEAAAYQVDGPLDGEALVRALAYLTARHDVMRCAIRQGLDGEGRQHFADRVEPVVYRSDLIGAGADRLTEALGQAVVEPFHLDRPPLVRTHLFRFAPDRHVVLFVAHHLIVDAWAFGVFLRQLSARYAVETGAAVDAGNVGADAFLDFGDVAESERNRPEPDLGYWRQRLSGPLPVLALPDEVGAGARPAFDGSGMAGEVRSTGLPASLVGALTALGRGELATLPAVVLTGFAAVLRRYTGQDDLVIGVPAAVRGGSGLATVLGPLLNLVAHRVDLAGKLTFRQALRAVRDRLRDDIRHRDVPFDLLVEQLGTGGGRTPLFQSMLVFHSGPPAMLTLPGTVSRPVPVHSGTAKYDVSLFCRPDVDGGLDLRLEYSTRLLARETATELLDALSDLLAAAAADPARPLADLNVLSLAARRQLLVDFNRSATTEPPYRAVPAALRMLVAAAPTAPAVISGGTVLTRADVDDLADRVARRLVGTYDVRPGDRVALRGRRTACLVPLIIGIWRAGAVLVPLDDALPAGRAGQILDDSAPALLITDDGPAGAGHHPATAPIEALTTPGGNDLTPVPFPDGPAPDALAYLMYTSGSTGRPKGVAVPHSGVANLLHSIATAAPGLSASDTLVAVTSITFDISILELFGPLVAGGRVVVAPDGVGRDPAALAALLRDSGATVMQATPSLWRGLLDAGWPAAADPGSDGGRAGLRAFCGGEALEPHLARRLLASCAEVWNLYGPTETTIWSTAGRVHPDEPVTVGRPVGSTVCYLLGPNDELVPRGAVGELIIGGAGVTAGYWRRPDLTAAAFVPDPVDPAGGTVYRTGDLARYLPDGRLVVLGRIDQQVKINGHRVELGEIEATLLAHPAVRQAVVLVDRSGDRPRLVAFVVPRDDASGSAAPDGKPSTLAPALRRHLGERLAAAVVPPILTFRSTLPLNVSGKVDRPALARMAEGLDAQTDRVAARTVGERTVAALWARAIGIPVEQVGVTDDFLAVGGTSIAATRLLAEVAAATGHAPSLAAFYREPSVAALARYADLSRTAGNVAPGPDPLASSDSVSDPAAPVPLTDQQRQFWLLHRLVPESAAYHLVARCDLTGPIESAALAGAVADLCDRHPVLAARCELVGDEPVLVHRPAVPVPVESVDLRGLTPADLPDRLDEAVATAATRPFDLHTGPLIRVVLLDLPGGRRTLLIAAHHIAVDGWSVGVALRELPRLYAARLGGDPLPPPQLDFIGHARADNATRQAAARGAELAYWTRRLAGYSGTLGLPREPQPEGDARLWAGSSLAVDVPPDRTASLREVAARLRATPFTVLLGVFATLLGRYAGSDDVVVGVPVANRGRPDVDAVIGLLMNTLPVRVRLTGGQRFAELIPALAESLATDLDHALVPFDRLVTELNLDRDLTRPALVQAMLVLGQAPPERLDFGGTPGLLRRVDLPTAKYELTLALDEHSDRLTGQLEYATGRFSADFATRFWTHFDKLLAAVLADPEALLDGVDLGGDPVAPPQPVLPPGVERDQAGTVFAALRRGAAAVSRKADGPVPEQPAIRYAGTVVGYGELERWSNGVAAALTRTGPVAGRFVSVLLPTGPAQTAAIIGIARAGAAFAVLDPADPDVRLTTLLRDAEPACVLASGPALAAHPGLWQPETARFGGERVVMMPDAAGDSPAAEPAPVRPGDPLCLVYTSGSTGEPKGIVLSHAAFAQFAAWQRERFGIGLGSRVAQWAPFTYDAAYTEVFAALTAGAVLCVPPEEIRRDPLAMVTWLRAERVSQLQTIPAFFAMITDALDATGGDLPDLAHVLLAGEVLPVGLVRRWRNRRARPRLHNLYGPTECILATHREIADDENFAGSVPIGTPIPGRQALVLDRHGRPCPVGVTGEIHLRSDLLAGTYHRRPAETERAYPPDPWRSGGRLYRTGDLGSYLPTGELAFAGRTDSQVKIRGNRVELSAVEALLGAHPMVREAAATVHGTDVLRLVGYAVLADGTSPGDMPARLRDHLAAQLPAAAVPDTVVLLDALPRTRSNKVDRARLPVPGAVAVDDEAPPREGLERLVAQAWRDVLDGRAVGRRTNFFDAGGDSLRAARLQVLLAVRLRQEVRLADIFARPTIAEFAAGLGDAGTVPVVAPSEAAGDGNDPEAAADARGRRRRAAIQANARRRQ